MVNVERTIRHKSFRAEVMRLGGWGVIHGWEVSVELVERDLMEEL